MNTEELIKKLEEVKYPEIEVASHKRRLKTALLSSSYFRKPHVGSFIRINTEGIELSLTRRILVPAGIVVLAALAITWRGVPSHQNHGQVNTMTATPVSPVSPATPASSASEQQPLLTIIEPMDNATVAASIISIRGKTEPGAIVSVNSEITVADEQGNFSVDLGLDAGLNLINITASDSSGGQSTTTIVTNSEEGA
jgi:hypothetical protein